MKYSTGGKINNGDTLSYLEAVNAELTELESKRNVRIKFGLDAKDQKRAEELLDTFNDKSKNGMNNYFVTARKGLNDLKNAYGDLLDTESAMKRSNDNAEISKLQKKYDQQVNDVVRLANAYQALGYQVKDKDKEIYDSILKVASAQEKLLQKKSGGSYQYTIKNFKELFDVMKELNELLEDNTGLSKNFAPFQLQLQDIESIEKKAKKAEQHLDKVWKKYGNKQLPSETRDSVIKNKAVIDVYRGAHKSITKEDYNASEGFQHFREMDIGEGYRDLDVYRETYSNLKGEYDTILSKMRKSCLKAAEKAQEEMLSGYGAISRDVEKQLYDGLIKQIDDAKKRVAYLEAEQAEKIASEFSSFENTSPKFARDKQTAGAYITNESYTKASQLYDSLFDQIEQEAISADEAIKIMAKDLVNAVAKGEANPFLTENAIASQEEIEKLLAKIKDLQEELQKAKDDADAWSESAYRNFDEKLGLESEVNKLRKDLEDKNDEIEGLQKNVNNLHETISILEDENEDLRNNKSSSDTGMTEYEKTLESYQGELGQAYSDLNQAMNKIAQMSLNMQDGQEGNFEGCCEALKSIQQILQGFDLSAFQDFPNFAETVKNTLSIISQSVKILEDVFTSADGGKITVNATTNMTLGGNDDPAMRQRAKELQNVFDNIFEEHQFRKSIKNVNNGLSRLETELEDYESQLESLYERRKTATKEDTITIDRMIASLEDTIEIQKQSIKKVSGLKPQQTAMAKYSISMTDLYGVMINTIPKLKQKYNGDIDAFMSAYSGQAISKLSAADKVDRLEELLGWIGELPKYKKTIDENTAKIITKYVSTELSQLSSSQQQESKLGISDTIDQILKSLQHIVQQLSKIQDIMGGDISNDIPNLKSDFLSERGTNLKNLFNQIGKKKGTDTFSTAKNNLDAIKNFLKQFHEYGNGEWSLDEFARINGISDKNLKILQQYNEELLSQGEIVPKLKREEKVIKEVVEAEKNQFKELSDSIGEVTVAEQKKTQVFQEEEQQTEKATKKTTKRKRKKKAVEEEVPEQQEKKTVYVDDKQKLKQTLMMERQVSNLLYNNNLNGDARKDMESLLATLKVVEKTTGMTKDEWADIQLIVTDLTNKAKTNINENKKLAQQEKEQAKANRDKLKSEKEREKLLKEENEAKADGQVAPKKSTKQTIDISQMSTNVETATSSLTNIQQDVSSIKNDVGALRKDATPETSNELSNALKGWVDASNKMAKIQGDEYSIFDALYDLKDTSLDRERAAFGDIKTGRITNPYITANKTSVPVGITNSLRESGNTLDIHSHPENYVIPSETDWKSYFKEGVKQALIVARKQMMLINVDALDKSQRASFVEEFEKRTSDESPSEEYVQYFRDALAEISTDFQTYIKTLGGSSKYYSTLANKIADEINDELRMDKLAYGSKYSKDYFHIGDIQDIIEKKGLNFTFGDKNSIDSFIKEILSDDIFNEYRTKTIGNAFNRIKHLDAFNTPEDVRVPTGDAINKALQMVLRDSYQFVTGKDNVDEFVKYLNYENPDELSASAINDFLGVQNSQQTFLEDIANTVRQIASILSSGKISLSRNEDVTQDGNAIARSARTKKKNSGWYGGYAEDMLKRNLNYSNIFDEDLQRYKSSIGQTGKSDLEYMTQFFKEYEDYFRRLAEATDDKDLRKKLKDYSSFIKEQKKSTLDDLKTEAKIEQKNAETREKVLEEESRTRIKLNKIQDQEAKKQELAAEKEQLKVAKEREKVLEEESRTRIKLNNIAEKNAEKERIKAEKQATQEAKTREKVLEEESKTRIKLNKLQEQQKQKEEAQAEKDKLKTEKDREKVLNEELNIRHKIDKIQQEEQEKQIKKNQLIAEAVAKTKQQYKDDVALSQSNKKALEKSLIGFDDLLNNDNLEGVARETVEKFVNKVRYYLKKDTVSTDLFSSLMKEGGSVSKNAKNDINRVSNRKASELGAEEKRRQKLQEIIDEVEKLYNSPDYTLRFKDEELSGFLSAIKEVRVQTSFTEEELENINKAYKEIKDSAKASAKEQSELNDLADKFDKIMTKKNNEDSLFYTKDYLDMVNDARSRLKAGTLSVEEGRNIYGGISDPNNIVGSSKSLNNYIRRGQQLIAQNYMPGNLKKQFEELVEAMQKVSKEGGHSRTEINKMVGAFQELDIEAAKAGKTLFGQIGQRLQDMNAKFIAQYFSFMDIVRYTRSMISTITELDTALTEMRKVSDESVKSLKEYQKTTFDTAGALGTTAVQLQQSTADWLRLGESMDEAAKSAQSATMLFNVSEFDNINEATTALVAMSQAYKDMDKTEIIDVMNNIGNNYAIATDELATALQASAASLMTQGNDLYEAAALVTAGNQIIQDADKVGTGLRTISLRIAGVKEGDDDIKQELEELGEEVDDWVVATQAKKRQVILDYTKTASNGGMGVDILDSNGNLRDTYHILLDIAKVYKEIQEEDKKYGTNRAKGLVEELAGKNRSNIAASILMNPELLEDVYNSALDSAGSAAEENAKYLDSIVGKTQQFKNELQELEQNLLSSELIKDVIDFGTQVLSIVNKLGKGLPVIAVGIGSIAAAVGLLKDKTQGLIKYDAESGALGIGKYDLTKLKQYGGEATSLGELASSTVLSKGDAFKNIFQIDYGNKSLKEYFNVLDSIGDKTKMSSEEIIRLQKSFNDMEPSVQKMATTLRGQGVESLEQFEAAEKETEVASKAAAVGVSILNTVITSLAIAAITAVITGLVKGFQALAESTDRASEAATEFRNELKDIRKEIKSNGDYIRDNGDEYARLSKEVDDLGHNISLSTDEFARYNTISNEIAEMFPTMVSGWTETGDAILKCKGSVEELNKAYQDSKKLELQKLIANDTDAKKIFKDYRAYKEVNPIEYFWANLRGKNQTGVSDSYESQKKFYEAFLKLTYDDLQDTQSKVYKEYYRANFGLSPDEELATLTTSGIPTVIKTLRGRADRYLGFQTAGSSADDLAIAQQKADAALSALEAEMNERLRGMRDLATAYLELQPDYDTIDEETREVANLIVNSLDDSLAESFEDDPKKLAMYVRHTVDALKGVDSDVLSTLLQNDIDSKNFKDTQKEIQDAWGEVYTVLNNEAKEAITNGDTDKFNAIVEATEKLRELSQIDEMDDLATRFNELNKAIASDDKAMARLNSVTKDFTKEQMEWWLDNIDATMNEVEAINKLNDAIEKGTFNNYESIGSLLSQDSFVNGTNTKWSEIREELVGLAQAGKLDEQTLKDYKWFNDILQELGLSAEEAEDKLAGMIEEIDKLAKKNAVDDLSNYRNEIDKLGDAYSKFKKGEFIDANTLSALQDAFGDLDSYQAFEEAVLSGQTDLQHYFDDIVTEYANQHKILNELTAENKEWVKQQLIASGITKESADAAVEDALKHKNALEKEVRAEVEALNSTKEIAQGKKELAIDTANLDKITIDEVNALLAETQATGIGAEKLKFFAAQKALAAMTGIRNNDDIDYLIKICELAGLGTEYLVNLKSMGDINYDKRIADAQKEMQKYEGRTDKNSIRRYNNAKNAYESGVRDKAEYEKQMKNALPDAQKAFDEKYKDFQYDFTGKFDFAGISDSASEAGSDAGEAFKDALDKILAMYDAELDASVITFQTYVDKSRQAIEQYYNEGKIKASEYYDYLANLYQKQVSEYDKVISAVQRLLKKQTDELQKQKEAIEESYNLQIEEIQKKIDALRDENDEIDKNMALQKAQ